VDGDDGKSDETNEGDEACCGDGKEPTPHR
jgi:hypothetical protein